MEEVQPGSGGIQSLTNEEIELRKRWLDLKQADERLVQEIDEVMNANVDMLMTKMYAQFLAFDETRSFFPDEATVSRAKSAQREYFLRLTKGDYGDEYVQDRLRIGATHHRIDLDPKWYLGAYSRILTWLCELLAERFAGDTDKLNVTISALLKVIFFDLGLAIDTYIDAKERALRQHRDFIHELETERRVTKSILERAPIGIVHLTPDCVCLECNPEFVQIVDAKNREEVLGVPLFDVAPHLPRQPFEAVIHSGEPISGVGEPLNLRSEPAERNAYWDWAIWPVKDANGETTGMVAKFTDATKRVQLQQQREDFVATLTHDLKTPILAANRALKLLMEGDFGPVAESQARILETIHQSNDALYQLVLTLLDVYRYDSGAKKLHIRPHDLAEAIGKLVTELRPLAEAKKIRLDAALPEDHPTVFCDPEEIRRVVQNLLDNSLKFTPPDGSVTVRMEQKDGITTVSVKDTGKGVPEEDKPKLFQRFWQATSSGRYYASTGLGLYLCRTIVELHGGRIWCESTPAKGSTFSFTIGDLSFFNAQGKV